MSNPTITYASDIVEDNGKTIRENNMELQHTIPVGTLVEVKYDTWFGDGACEKNHARLWVIIQGRDCDGTPIYWLSTHSYERISYEIGATSPEDVANASLQHKLLFNFKGGFCEEGLTVVDLTDDVHAGHGALEWDDNG